MCKYEILDIQFELRAIFATFLRNLHANATDIDQHLRTFWAHIKALYRVYNLLYLINDKVVLQLLFIKEIEII